MSARTLILWRHGETDWNREGRLQGYHDIPMNAEGQAQARRAATALAELGPTRIVSSDLGRARMTAEELSRTTGLPVETDQRLREINVGDWVGRTHADIAAADPLVAEAMRNGEDYRRSGTGETSTELGTRIAAALHDIAESSDDDDVVVVVTHGMAARVGAVFFVGGDWVDTRFFGGFRNCAWTVLGRGGDEVWRIRQYNIQA